MKIRNQHAEGEKIELQMTPMIDIVFQLLVFFIMTFKIVIQEGDFNIKMPLAAPAEGLPDEDLVPPIKVTLEADSLGNLSNIRLNDTNFGHDWSALQNKIIETLGDERGPGSIQESAEVEFDPDSNLKYKFTVRAITEVSGYKNRGSDEIITLVEKIKFTPPAEED